MVCYAYNSYCDFNECRCREELITWPYGHGEGRVDFIIIIIGNILGGSWVSLGGKLSCLGGGGGKLPLRPPP